MPTVDLTTNDAEAIGRLDAGRIGELPEHRQIGKESIRHEHAPLHEPGL